MLFWLVCLIFVSTARSTKIPKQEADTIVRFYSIAALKVLARDVDGVRALCQSVHDSWCYFDNEFSLVNYATSTNYYEKKIVAKKGSCLSRVDRYFVDRRLNGQEPVLEEHADKFIGLLRALLGEDIPSYSELKKIDQLRQEDSTSLGNLPQLTTSDLEFLSQDRKTYLKGFMQDAPDEGVDNEFVRPQLYKRNGVSAFGQFLWGLVQFSAVWTVGLIAGLTFLFSVLVYAGVVGAMGAIAGCFAGAGHCCLGCCALGWDCLTCRGCCGACPLGEKIVTKDMAGGLCKYPVTWGKGACDGLGATAAVHAAGKFMKNLPQWSMKGFHQKCQQ